MNLEEILDFNYTNTDSRLRRFEGQNSPTIVNNNNRSNGQAKNILKFLAWLQTLVGFILLVMGIWCYMLATTSIPPAARFCRLSTPVWCGLVNLFAGVFGLIGLLGNLPTDLKRLLVGVFLIGSVIGGLFAVGVVLEASYDMREIKRADYVYKRVPECIDKIFYLNIFMLMVAPLQCNVICRFLEYFTVKIL